MSDTSPGTDHDSPSQFDLLGLPREIRNLIYKYALSEPEGLFFRKERTAFEIEHNLFTAFATPEAAADKDARDQNQLKYVCRQLRSETIGLAVEVNDLVFEIPARCRHFEHTTYTMLHTADCVRYNPFDILEGFLETCSSKRLAQIRKIASFVEEYGEFLNPEKCLMKAMSSDIITSFLSDYPRATFNWYLHPRFKDLGELRRHAIPLQLYLTDRDPGNNPFLNHCNRLARYLADGYDWASDGLQVSNYKIWPPRSLRIDYESAACEAYQDNAHFQKTAPDGISEAVEECKRWIEHSILDSHPLRRRSYKRVYKMDSV